MNKKEENTTYGVWILRRDGDHIQISETTKYDEAFQEWDKMQKEWALCVQETRPFVLTSPMVAAFEPSLIYEITLRPVVETTSNTNHNPYKKVMNQNGFGSTFGNSQLLSDVKDGGYL